MADKSLQQQRSLGLDRLLLGTEAVEDESKFVTNKWGIQQIRFGTEEMQRRRETPVFISGEDVRRAHKNGDVVFIVDDRLGFANKTHRFWINHLPAGGEEGQQWKTIGHRHTVEAIIYYLEGHGYSVIDGERYEWEAGDFVCVPMFAWHRHVNLSGKKVRYAASTTGPLMARIGQAVYEDENYPEHWIFAQLGDDSMDSLIPGGANAVMWNEDAYTSLASDRYREDVSFAAHEESLRRQSRVLVKHEEIAFDSTPLGSIAHVVDPRVGFYTKALGALIAEVPTGGRSGSHRHLYDEIDFILDGEGDAVVDDVTFRIKAGDTISVPPFAWHQYFNTGTRPLRVLAFHTRIMLENLGLSLVQQGELAAP